MKMHSNSRWSVSGLFPIANGTRHHLVLLVLILVPLLFAFTSDEGSETRKSLPPGCFVRASNPAKGLSKTKSQLCITFKTAQAGIVTDSIAFSYNGVNATLHPDKNGIAWTTVPATKTRFQFYLNDNYYEVYSDSIVLKGGYVTEMDVYFGDATGEVICDKPVIYVYPAQSQPMHIQLGVKGTLGFTYPQYYIPGPLDSAVQGWSFTADPNGTIHQNGKEYDYLFWDAKVPTKQFNNTIGSGFFVHRDSLVPFFERTLTQMGLNAREQQDFITYWCPLMQKNETSFVHFMFTEEYDSIATINITPKPDHLFRVFMVWRDADAYDYTEVLPQEIPKVNREGFTVIEWGGGEIPAEFSAQ